jgi:hypothetical protein
MAHSNLCGRTICAFAFFCVGHVWAELSSSQVFDDVLRDFSLIVETAPDGKRNLRIDTKGNRVLLQTITSQECFGASGFSPYAGDFDFDGHEDFACKSTWGGAQHTAFFRYDPEKKRFAFSFELLGLEIQPDPKARTLTSIGFDDSHSFKKQTYQMRGSRPVLTQVCTASPLDGQVPESQPDFHCDAIATPESVLRDFYFEYDGYQDEDAEKNAALRIYRKKTGKRVQTLELAEYFTYSEFDDKLPAGVPNYSWASKLRAGDFNFDGLEDFAVSSFCGNVNCVTDYYLYDPKRQQFRRGFYLSGYDTDFDPASKTVTVSARGNALTHHQTTYRIQGFQLIPKSVCTRSLNLIEPDAGIAVTLSGGNLALDLRFGHHVETAGGFSGTVRFSSGKSASPQCPLRLKDKEVLAYNAKGRAQRVAWTLDVDCGVKLFGTLSLILSDTEGEWIQGSYRQLGDGKVIPLKWDNFCEDCDGGNCEPSLGSSNRQKGGVYFLTLTLHGF